ncbi:hypothetical protein E2C01_069283 [Portunus trituberculatus]|uniref:Uncharacterized protein n=1 Tax=Portunus trituberculatus TaxID=210409 RepID=A0A5B7HY48_PORTR|nr:hypothetical protein [Portunus trituberculatus]
MKSKACMVKGLKLHVPNTSMGQRGGRETLRGGAEKPLSYSWRRESESQVTPKGKYTQVSLRCSLLNTVTNLEE